MTLAATAPKRITIFDQYGKPYRPEKPKPARAPQRGAYYDSAQTTDENRKHWANADYLSANASNSHGVRERLRTRSRYERANNGYAKGLIRGRTNDTIGTGPRLQLDLPERTFDPDFQRFVPVGTPTQGPADLARAIERKWRDWCNEVHFADKMRTLADAEDTDGEGFGVFTTNHALAGVQLDLRVIECDRVRTPDRLVPVDGMELNKHGEPVFYHVLQQHPGDMLIQFGMAWTYDRVPAAQVVHLFEIERPEQLRGVPLLTSALPLYAILRRFTLASLGRAELAAMIAGVIETDGPPDSSGEEAPEFEAMDQVPFARNALLTLAAGQKAKAFDAAPPSQDYGAFKSEVLTEAGRAAGENRNTSTGSSAEYNYSSGRLDHLPRRTGIRIRRERWERKLLDRAFRAWLAEAALIPGFLPDGLPPVSEWEWKWQWDGFESIDPVKDATAAEIRKATGLTTDADELAAQGKDWREHYQQLAREKAERVRLGIEPVAPAAPTPAAAAARQGFPDDQPAPARGGARA